MRGCGRKFDSTVAEKPIKITLKDGSVRDGVAGVTTPADIAKAISQGLLESSVAAKVNDEVRDLFRPLEDDCKLDLLDFDSKEGNHVFWHSSAHILGQALVRSCITMSDEAGIEVPRKLVHWPSCRRWLLLRHVHQGSVWILLGETDVMSSTIVPDEFPEIEKVVEGIVKQKQPFERFVLTKEEALDLFSVRLS